jgi:leucyl aminopeptidase
MKFTIKHGDLDKQRKASLIIGISDKGELTPAAKRLDKTSHGFISKLIKQGDFKGKIGNTFLLPSVPHTDAEHILLVGCGKSLTLNERDFRRIVASSAKALNNTSATHGISYLTELDIEQAEKGSRDIAWRVKQIVEVSTDALYQFHEYKSEKAPATSLKEITIAIADKKDLPACEKALKQGIAISAGVSYTKNLGNQPSNVCTPTYVADQAKKLAKEHKAITVKVLEEKDMKKLGMGAFLSVTKGSAQNTKAPLKKPHLLHWSVKA